MSRPLPQIVLDRLLSPRGQQSGLLRQPFEGWDLWKILLAEKPRKIVEHGSGITSAAFVLYAGRHDAECVSFEASPRLL